MSERHSYGAAIDKVDDWHEDYAGAIMEIVRKWEDDVDDAFRRGQDSVYEAAIPKG